MKECETCGGNLSYDAELQRLVCSDCGEMYDEVIEKQIPDEMTFL